MDKSLNDKIRELRKLHKLSQDEFAKKIGISRSNISKYESGKIEPGINMLKVIAKSMEVPMTYFIDNSTIKIKNKKDKENNIDDKFLKDPPRTLKYIDLPYKKKEGDTISTIIQKKENILWTLVIVASIFLILGLGLIITYFTSYHHLAFIILGSIFSYISLMGYAVAVIYWRKNYRDR